MPDFITSWRTAEQAAYSKLLSVCPSDVDKQSAFLGELPEGRFGLWGFWTSGGVDGDHTWAPAQHPQRCVMDSLRFNGQISGRYAQRDEAQDKAMELLQAFNIFQTGNIQWFRVADGGMPTVDSEVIELANQRRTPYKVWRFDILTELVFNTAKEY